MIYTYCQNDYEQVILPKFCEDDFQQGGRSVMPHHDDDWDDDWDDDDDDDDDD